MSDGQNWRRLLRIAFNKRHASEQVDDELHFHIETLVERLVSQGKSEEDARREVMERFGSYRKTHSFLARGTERRVHAPGWQRFLDGLRQDLRISLRACLKRPGFTALAAVTAGLGIGACATLFSVVDSVLLRPLPYPESERIVHIGTTRQGRPPGVFTAPEFLALRNSTRTLEHYAAYRYTSLTVPTDQGPMQYSVAAVTRDYFDVYGVHPQIGRGFLLEDYEVGREPVAVVSFRFWQQNLGSIRGVIGETVRVSGRVAPHGSVTIVGVMPRGFVSDADLWLPERLAGTWWEGENMFTNSTHSSVGRLAPGMTVEHVQDEVVTLSATLASDYPQYYSGRYYEGRSIGVLSLLDRTVVGYRNNIVLLFGAASLLLLIAVANLTGLYLARMLDRQQEVAVRAALGAGRGRIARQFVTEATLLSLLGSLFGILIAMGGVRGFRLLAPTGFPRLGAVSLNASVVAFAIAVAVLCGLACGWLPVVVSSGRASQHDLHGGTRSGGHKSTTRTRGLMVGLQVAVATYLLIGAGLLGNNFLRLQQVDPGVEAEGLVVMPIQIPEEYDTVHEYTSFLHETVRQVAAIPGVESASWTPDPPMYGGWWNPEVVFSEADGAADNPNVRTHPVGPDYFRAVGVPILEGRGIGAEDVSDNRLIAVVDDVCARRFWPAEDPLGKQLRFEPSEPEGQWHTVVGVVGSTHMSSLAEEPVPQIYVPALQRTQSYGQSRIVIRSSLPATTLAPMLREAVWEVDPSVPAPTVEKMEERISADLHDPRFHSILLGSFSLAALVLTLTGIYGLMLCVVTSRTREIGIRSALGAGVVHVLWTISRQSLFLISVGLAAGFAAAAGTSQVLGALLFAVSPLDVPTFGFVAVGLGITALFACLVPAWRATRVEPTTALRAE